MRLDKKVKIPKPKVVGLRCPLCGNRTLCRDVSPQDKWYVEWCMGGRLRFKEIDEDGEEVVYEFECPYWWADFLGAARNG